MFGSAELFDYLSLTWTCHSHVAQHARYFFIFLMYCSADIYLKKKKKLKDDAVRQSLLYVQVRKLCFCYLVIYLFFLI